MIPSVGSTVHYVSYGTPGGEYASECRAAIVTEVGPGLPPEIGTVDGGLSTADVVVGLCVLNPSGQFFNRGVVQHEPVDIGDGLQEIRGGTWHWPERVE